MIFERLKLLSLIIVSFWNVPRKARVPLLIIPCLHCIPVGNKLPWKSFIFILFVNTQQTLRFVKYNAKSWTKSPHQALLWSANCFELCVKLFILLLILFFVDCGKHTQWEIFPEMIKYHGRCFVHADTTIRLHVKLTLTANQSSSKHLKNAHFLSFSGDLNLANEKSVKFKHVIWACD